MAYSFGSSSPAPGATSAFSFGSSAPAPATGGGGGGGFSFGPSTTTPAAPSSTTGFSFLGGGAPTAAAPTGGAFSFASSAPATGFSFAGAPAPATGFSGFGAPPPASASSFFGQTPQQQQQHLAPQRPVIAGNMLYSNLPAQYKSDIENLFNMIRQHQRTMEHVKSMAPHQLVMVDTEQLSQSSTPSVDPLLTRTSKALYADLDKVSKQIRDNTRKIEALGTRVTELHQQVFLYAKWPLEAVAIRRGVRIEQPPSSREDEKKQDDAGRSMDFQVQSLLDSQLQYVDRVDRMPSPLLWTWLQEWQQRAETLQQQASQQLEQLAATQQAVTHNVPMESLVRLQHSLLVQNAFRIAQLQKDMEVLRHQYAMWERGENVLLKAEQEELAREQRWKDAVLLKYVEAASNNTTTTTTTPGSSMPSMPAPSSSGFSFGGGSNTPAPAPAGGLFSTTSGFGAPAPATTFGSTTAASTTTTPAFGATPAPAFGATSTFAPTAPSVRKKSSSSSSSSNRSSGRLRR